MALLVAPPIAIEIAAVSFAKTVATRHVQIGGKDMDKSLEYVGLQWKIFHRLTPLHLILVERIAAR